MVTFKSSTYKICASGLKAYEKALHTSKSSKHLQYSSCTFVIFFPLLIIIIMCQLSKCLFCVRIQRTDEVCDEKSQDKTTTETVPNMQQKQMGQ